MKLSEGVGTSFTFEFPREIEIIDITIPRETFLENRAYDISLGMASTSTVKSATTTARRLVLYNGGYEIPARPCAAPRLESHFRPIEIALLGARRDSLIFADVTENIEQARKAPTYVEGGSTVTVYGSLFRHEDSVRVTALQPTVNGEPFGELIWATKGGPFPRPGTYAYVDARYSFTYDVPAEPGLYEIVVMSWEYPFETWRELDGDRIPNVTSASSPREHSNSIRLVVPEPG